MIIVKNRELLIPNNERYIGTTYDNDTENRVFQVPRFSQRGVDLANLTFRLDIQYANESYDTVVLDKEVGEAFIILIWRITSATLQVPGTMYIGLRAIDDEATVKWSSFSAAMYAERHLNTPGNYGGSLTEIEQIEQDHQYMKGVVDELKENIDYAHDAEAWAKGTRSGSAVPSTDPTYHNNSKYYSDQANTKATQAANSATAAANSATQAAETVSDTNTRFNNAMAAVTSETEVIDARVGADGTQYPVLKTRLDTEHTQLKSALEALADATAEPVYQEIQFTAQSGKIINDQGTVVDTLANYYVSSPIPVTQYSDYYVTARSNFYNMLVAWYNASQTFISGIKGNGTSTIIEKNDEQVRAPANAAYLRIAWFTDTTHLKAGAVKTLESYTNKLSDDITDIQNSVNLIAEETVEKEYSSVSFTESTEKIIQDNGAIVSTIGESYRVSSYIPVVPGNTYYITASANYRNSIFAWYDSSHGFISRYKPGGATGGTVEETDNEAFVAPEGAAYLAIAYIAPRSGDVKELSGYKNILDDDVTDLDRRVTALEEASGDAVAVRLQKSGNEITMTDIDSGKYFTATLNGSNNGALVFGRYYNADGTTYKIADDDICPIYYDRSHRCGGHGNLVALKVTSTAHGLTESDIGAVVTSANGIEYVIIRIVDANTFWMVNNTATHTFITTIPTSPLTYGSMDIAFSAAALQQIFPGINNIRQKIYADGTEVTSDGAYTASAISIVEIYDSIDCLAMLEALKANVGNNTNASYYADSIQSDLTYAVTYIIRKNLDMLVEGKIIIQRDDVDLTSWGLTQFQSIGHRFYVPDSNDEGVWTASAQKTYTPSTWENASFPPYKAYQFADNAADGFAFSYYLKYEDGKAEKRTQNCISMALNLTGAFKVYPFIVSKNTNNYMSKGTVLSGIVHRQIISYSDPLVMAYKVDGSLIVEIDTLSDGVKTVQIPNGYNGKLISVTHQSGATVLSTSVQDNTVMVMGKGSISIKVA